MNSDASQIQLNEDTGLFEPVIPEEAVPDQEDVVPIPVGDDVQIIDLGGDENDRADLITGAAAGDSLSDQTEASQNVEKSEDVGSSSDSVIIPYAAVSSNQQFSPQSWQINLAENREIGQHYAMWAERIYYNNYNNYWKYYLVLADDMTYENDLYNYQNAELYEMYTYNDQTNYSMAAAQSGSVSGSAYLVYSDLYFDFCGKRDPVNAPYVIFAFLFIVIVLLVLILKRK